MRKSKMEELLNKLIEKGWKPFGENRIDEINRAEQYAGNWNWCCWGSKDAIQRRKSTRQLTSKESGLWQFVCENNLVDYDTESGWGEFSYNSNYINGFYGDRIMENDYRYRVIESALKDECELEDFLLNSIIIDD